MSQRESRQEELERELDEAIKSLGKTLDRANGNCAKKIRGRTTKVRRSLMDLLGEENNE